MKYILFKLIILAAPIAQLDILFGSIVNAKKCELIFGHFDDLQLQILSAKHIRIVGETLK